MAVKHRKLYPLFGTTNETINCPNFCDPACPYNCYPYADYDLLAPPPPPPPSQDHRLSPYVIVLVSVLASFFLVVSYYVIVAKSCPRWCSSRNNRHRQPEAENADDQDFDDENEVDHPIWFITTTGLQQSIINSITACKYKKGEGLIEGTECSVCLSEFQQDETVRLLPKCNHAFHISCIDTWLRSHTNCPLCRAHIVNDPVNTPLISVREDTENVNTTSSTPMENPDGELEITIQAGDETRGDEDNEDERTSKENANSDTNGNFEIICESDNHHRGAENDIQPIRRSISTESLAAETMNLGLKITSSSIELENLEQSHTGLLSKQIGSSSISQHLHKSPVPMKRSFSCSGRFFSSRQYRNVNSVLPL